MEIRPSPWRAARSTCYLTVARRKKHLLSAEQMEAELDKLAAKCPPLDCQAVLDDLRS